MTLRRPPWLVKKLPVSSVREAGATEVHGLIADLELNTVCRSARCPNLSECFARRTATFMIMGDVCTRGCRFCAVKAGAPASLSADEPARVAEAARRLDLRFVVVTSVTRDDLPDGGAEHFARTVRALHDSGARAEVLVPDFRGSGESVAAVALAAPEVFAHNLETVPRLYPEVRMADYRRSLGVLAEAAHALPEGSIVKSGLMLGLGERPDEVEAVMADMLAAGCRALTLGQYLSPDGSRVAVSEYVAPERFEEYGEKARELGFAAVASGPFVRSSYRAAELWRQALPHDVEDRDTTE